MIQAKVRTKIKLFRFLERLLLAIGVFGVTAFATSYAILATWQSWANFVFDREVAGQSAGIADYVSEKADFVVEKTESLLRIEKTKSTAVSPEPRQSVVGRTPSLATNTRPGVATNTLVGRLTIPRLHLASIVREGDGEDTLGFAAGHIPGTALPGENGNVGVAAHRDKLFRGLGSLRQGDVITFQTFDETYRYAVTSMQIVKPEDVDVLRPNQYAELTLVTCYPFHFIGSAPDRFIVKARQIVASESSVPTNAAPYKPASFSMPSHSALDGDGTHSESKVSFVVSEHHSQHLAPGISLGVSSIDPSGGTVNGWLWIMPDRRTVWLRNQSTRDPIFFSQENRPRELLITGVTGKSITGYLLVPEKAER